MSEDEPMEREVAIDPEMLGKVFENLLEVRDRKSKGAFYTPREIVHYMCQESLINYLVRKTGLKETDIRDFILYGDFMKDEDTSKEKREGNGGMYISEEIFKIDAEGNIVINRLTEIDEALASVKVADPAVGSGAFPLGMMNEIVRARQNITAYMSIGMSAYNKRMLYQNDRSPYILKYNTIKNCLYAVDIEPSAVDIAQLRLWLSLVIDDEINPAAQNELEGHRDPLPLPNLECNILCGNSLIDEFKGVKLVRETDILGTTHTNTQIRMGQDDFEIILNKLLEEQDLLFRCDDPIKKLKHKEAIQSYKDMIVSKEVIGNPTFMEEYKKATAMSSKPFIVWELDFARVFRDNGGFDIVIGNPPYVSVKGISDNDKKLFRKLFSSAQGRFNLFCLMIEKGKNILKGSGNLCFIQPEGIFTNIEYRHIRKILIDETSIVSVTMVDQRVFETAAVDAAILHFVKAHSRENVFPILRNMKTKVFEISQDQINEKTEYLIPVSSNHTNSAILDKIKEHEKWAIGDLLEIQQGIIYSGSKKEDIFSNEKVNDLFKPSLDGRDVRKWYICWDEKKENRYIEYTKKLHRPREERIFTAKEKILLPRKSTDISCGYDNQQYYALNTAYICLPKLEVISLKCLLGILNSRLMNYYYKNVYLGWQITIPALNSLPIAFDSNLEPQIVELVDYIISHKGEDISQAEHKIDVLVYKLYELTEQEISIVEGK